MGKPSSSKSIYKKRLKNVISQFNSETERGLNKEEVQKKRNEYGKNKIKESQGISLWEILLEQFKDVIVLLLLTAAIIAFLIGDMLEGYAILGVIVVQSAFGFITEFKAEKSLQALKEMMTNEAKVIREGEIQTVAAENLVPGDIMIMEEGDRVNADGRLLESDKLRINESVLTGEAEPVSKDYQFSTDEDVPLAERKNMVFMGTEVTRGKGRVLVTGTGMNTEMGKISDMLEQTETEATPLEQRLNKMGKALINVTLIIAAVVTIMGIVVGKPVIEMLKTGIALAIAAVPEGLPAVATITLAIGMHKMVKNQALVRRLPAVETLGSTTIICTDKTGTITENQMTLEKIVLSDKEIEITGTGYKPEGKFKTDGEIIDPKENEDLDLFLKTGTLCSNAVLNQEDSLWKVIGDPTEGALVTAGRKAGYNRQEMEKNNYQRLEEIPFDSDIKYMGVSYKCPEDNYVFIKGAPDVVLEMCEDERVEKEFKKLSPERKEQLKSKNIEMAKNGYRVLALAYKKGKDGTSEQEIQEVIDSGLTFLGFAGILDPPRQEVKQAISDAHSAGIRTIMITGDQKDTALSIAEKVGINDSREGALTGPEIDRQSEQELSQNIDHNSVFSRVSPANKLKIVSILNGKNEITAMTGDGVNDAPALKKADIGVSMGERGTSVARSASDMVLLDDSFATIVKAVRQGRVIFDNIQKFIYYLFSSNLSEIIFIFLGIILQVPIPLLALQILWLNLVIDVFPALSLGWELPEPNVMQRPPRDPDKSILNNKFKKVLLIHGTIIALGPLIAYLYMLNGGYPIELCRTISFAALSFTQLFHVFDARRRKGIGFDKTAFRNIYLWLAVAMSIISQMFALYHPFFQKILSTVSLSLENWIPVIIAFIIPILVIQLHKIYLSHKDKMIF